MWVTRAKMECFIVCMEIVKKFQLTSQMINFQYPGYHNTQDKHLFSKMKGKPLILTKKGPHTMLTKVLLRKMRTELNQEHSQEIRPNKKITITKKMSLIGLFKANQIRNSKIAGGNWVQWIQILQNRYKNY